MSYFSAQPPFPDADTPNRKINNAMESFMPILRQNFATSSLAFKLCSDVVEGLTAADTVDGVHPRLEVHERIGKKLADFIERNISAGA